MSTCVGQSVAQPLHERQRSSASKTSLFLHDSMVVSPWKSSTKSLARPLVECISSCVTRYDGHMTPLVSLRHFPTPTQRSSALWSEPPSCSNGNAVATNSDFRYFGPYR